MGWRYEYRIAYGIIVDSWNNPGLELLLRDLNHLLGYNAKMSYHGDGTLFVYALSTYRIIATDTGNYSHNYPDIVGDNFNPPRHPLIHRVDEELSHPKLTTEENIALRKVKIFCKSKCNKIWIRHSHVSY